MARAGFPTPRQIHIRGAVRILDIALLSLGFNAYGADANLPRANSQADINDRILYRSDRNERREPITTLPA
jgi:hypothetical protein